MFDLSGDTAVVTGAARGLGKAMAHGLASDGADVAILELIDGNDTCEEIAGECGVQTKYHEVDATDEGRIEQVVGEVVEDFGSVDILLNKAGIYDQIPATETTRET
jgi:NAD(P)-dependent dehydrogenase (short-subunit alcohol dehydrogenase family)